MDLECIALAFTAAGVAFALGQLVVAVCPWIRLRTHRRENRQRCESRTAVIRRRLLIVQVIEIDVDGDVVPPATPNFRWHQGVNPYTANIPGAGLQLEQPSLAPADGRNDLNPSTGCDQQPHFAKGPSQCLRKD